MPQLWIIAGPNGAGKTTLVSRRVARRVPVVNPDTIAEQLPRIEGRLDERQAGVLALKERKALLDARADFAIETTMSGHSAIQFMRAAAKARYKLTLVYVGLDDAELSGLRVAERIRRGGHSVPIDAIQRRYPDTMSKLSQAVELANRAYVLDNSDRRRRLLLSMDGGRVRFRARSLPLWLLNALPDVAG